MVLKLTLLCGLHNNPVIDWDYELKNDSMIVNNELEGMRKETVVASFIILFQHLHMTEENNEKTSVRIIRFPDEIRTGHLTNTIEAIVLSQISRS